MPVVVGALQLRIENQTANTIYNFAIAQLIQQGSTLTYNAKPFFAIIPVAKNDSLLFRYIYTNNFPFPVAFYVSHVVEFGNGTKEVIRGFGSDATPIGEDVNPNSTVTLVNPYSYSRSKMAKMIIRIIIDRIDPNTNQVVQRLLDTTHNFFIDTVKPEFRNIAQGIITLPEQQGKLVIFEVLKNPWANSLQWIRGKLIEGINSLSSLFPLYNFTIEYTELDEPIYTIANIKLADERGKIYIFISPKSSTQAQALVTPQGIPLGALIAIAVVVGTVIFYLIVEYMKTKALTDIVNTDIAYKTAQRNEYKRLFDSGQITSEQYFNALQQLDQICQANKSEQTSLFNMPTIGGIGDLSNIFTPILLLGMLSLMMDIKDLIPLKKKEGRRSSGDNK